MKKNNGITLIALVITIIVLLILAGVSIAMLGGTNGILGKASEASEKNAVAEVKDEIGLAVSNALAEYYDEVYVNQNTTVWTADNAGKKKCMDDLIDTFTAKYASGEVIVEEKTEGSDNYLVITSGSTSSKAKINSADSTLGEWDK